MAILADGTIPAIRGVIFEAGVDGPDLHTDVVNFDKVDVTKITLFNKIAMQQTVVLYVRQQFGELRKLRQYRLLQNENAEYLEHGEFLPLQYGDEIEAETGTDDAVDFVIYGTVS